MKRTDKLTTLIAVLLFLALLGPDRFMIPAMLAILAALALLRPKTSTSCTRLSWAAPLMKKARLHGKPCWPTVAT